MYFVQPEWLKHTDDRTDKKALTSISSVSPHPDGTKIVTGGLDTKLKVWSTQVIFQPDLDAIEETPKLLFTGTAHNGSILCVRFSNDGQYIASGADDRILALWELQASDETGKKVFGSTELNVEVWKPVRMLPGHENDILAVAWSVDDRYLASAGVDTFVLIWDGHTFAPLHKLAIHDNVVKGLSFDPVGQYLASQAADRTVKIWDTTDWSLAKDITQPFEDAPNDSTTWFFRPDWSPDGSFLIVPNAMNGPVFVAGIIERERDFEFQTSLVGHQNIVTSIAYSPIMFLKDLKKPVTDGANVVALFAIAARSSISIWMSSISHPIVVLDDVFDRDILDIQWSSDSKHLWACSSEGHVGVFTFDLKEFGSDANPAPDGAKERFHIEKWGFVKPPRVNRNFGQPSTNSQIIQNFGPIQPQKTTIMANGKKRIQPSLIAGIANAQPQGSSGGISQPVVFTSVTTHASPSKSRPLTTTAGTSTSASFATAAGSGSNPFTSAPFASTSKNKLPSRPPSPSAMRLSKKPAAVSADDGQPSLHFHPPSHPMFASSAALRDSMPPNLDVDMGLRPPKHNRSVKGTTLGGSKERDKVVIEEIAPAFIPTTSSSEARDMKLAVPAIRTFLKAVSSQPIDIDEENEINCLECRNFREADRPTEVAHLSSNGEKGSKTMWVDYLEHKVVEATWNGVFGAVSTSEGRLTVYSSAGRRLLPSMCLDAPCSFLDAAGSFLLAITARGRMHVWNVMKNQAVMPPSYIADLLEAHEHATIRSAKIRPNGTPVLSLSDGHIYSYHTGLQSWTVVSSPWFSKGSEHWEGRTRGKTGTTARGVLKGYEGITHDILVDQKVNTYGTTDMDLDVSVEGESMTKLGQESDWASAMTLAHLEARLAACEVLDSPQEYRASLQLYVARIGSDGFRNKAEEVVRAFMGPIYFKPEGYDSWQATVCGFQKRDLLKEILSQWAKSGPLKKLATDSQAYAFLCS